MKTDPKAPPKRSRNTVPLAPGESKESKCLAVVILEVLAGVRTPGQAAEVLRVSLPHYYQLEARALRGLVGACEPKPKGRRPRPGSAEAALRRENERLLREVTRQQSLVRLTQRQIGLAPPPAAKPAPARKRKRRASVRALQMAERLQREAAEPPAAAAEPAVAAAAVGP